MELSGNVRDAPMASSGLSIAEARKRLAHDGANELPSMRPPAAWRNLAAQMFHFFALMLWIAGLLAFVADMPQLGVAIFVVVIVNGVFAFEGKDLPVEEEELGALLDHDGVVLARIHPEDKLRITRALQRRGHVVEMTGDGVNDGPALQQADIGIAMGQSGTDVAREAADLVLLDDDFATIVAAVEHGRATFTNAHRFLTYHLTDNVGPVVDALRCGHSALVAATQMTESGGTTRQRACNRREGR